MTKIKDVNFIGYIQGQSRNPRMLATFEHREGEGENHLKTQYHSTDLVSIKITLAELLKLRDYSAVISQSSCSGI